MKEVAVLIVEDDNLIRTSLENYLTNEGFQVKSASSATEALVLLQEFTFNVCLTDIRLPDDETGEWILGAKSKQNIKWLLYTGVVDYELPVALQELGIGKTDLLYKPMMTLSDVKRKITSVFQGMD